MSQQPCRLTVGELRKIVTRARRDNHLTGPANKEHLIELFERHADMDASVGQALVSLPLNVHSHTNRVTESIVTTINRSI